MKPRHYLLIAAPLCVLVYWLLPAKERGLASPRAAEVDIDVRQEHREKQAELEKETQIRIAQLARLEEEQAIRDQAEARASDIRHHLELANFNAWSSLISTNKSAFEALRKTASESPNGQTPCTLCNGHGRMSYCFFPHGRSGQCITCKGTGKLSPGEICPTCHGRKKCFLCYGTGKMTCPFCDDGTIDAKGPMPSPTLPVR